MWLTAGTKLLFAVHRSRSRPDFLIGLGLLTGGLLIGLTTWPLAGQGAFPAEALVAGGALFWALYGDEANALQPGDRWMPVLVIGCGGMVLHFAFTAAGAQPVLDLGVIALRPFELPAVTLLGYLWFRRLTGDGEHRSESFIHLTAGNVRDILWATAAASLGSLIGGTSGDTLRFLFLCVVPASFLFRALRTNTPEIVRIAGVAAACSLGFLGLERSSQTEYQRSWFREAMPVAMEVSNDYAVLQQPVDLALNTWTHADAQRLYGERQTRLVANLQKLQESSARAGFIDLTKSCRALDKLVTMHGKLSRDVFEATAMRSAQWGDDEATARAETRAHSVHKESQATYERGLVKLRNVEGYLSDSIATFGDGIQAMGSTIFALFLATVLVGLALLISPLGGRSPVNDRYVETEDTGQSEPGGQPEPGGHSEPGGRSEPVEQSEPGEHLSAEFERLAQVVHELTDYLQEKPVAAAAYDCMEVLRSAARGLPSDELLASVSALERALKSGGEQEVTAAGAELSTVWKALATSGTD